MEEIKQPEGAAADKQQLRLDESSADTCYANFFLVSTSVEEFLLSFGVRSGEANSVKLSDRIIVSPKNFKRMVIAVSQALKMYEDRIGTIDVTPQTVAESREDTSTK